MYSTQILHLSRQLYLLRKRPRETWDPTLWKILLLPLPKKHKAHWTPMNGRSLVTPEPMHTQLETTHRNVSAVASDLYNFNREHMGDQS